MLKTNTYQMTATDLMISNCQVNENEKPLPFEQQTEVVDLMLSKGFSSEEVKAAYDEMMENYEEYVSAQKLDALQKPNWTAKQIVANLDRSDFLTNELQSHFEQKPGCQCNLCLELLSIDTLLDTFSEDELAGAVIEIRKQREMIVQKYLPQTAIM